jgi:hypothetical protein
MKCAGWITGRQILESTGPIYREQVKTISSERREQYSKTIKKHNCCPSLWMPASALLCVAVVTIWASKLQGCYDFIRGLDHTHGGPLLWEDFPITDPAAMDLLSPPVADMPQSRLPGAYIGRVFASR